MVRWVGRDADRTLSADDRALLRSVFGIDDVRRLYLPATGGEVLRYAARPSGCPDESRTTRHDTCRVVSVRVGLAAPRTADETWDAYAARVTRGGTRSWLAGGRTAYSGLDALDSDARPAFERLVEDARRAGFPVHVRETYRTPERQAFILARNDGRTTTATSAHSYGRAVDISVGDGRIGRRSTYHTWVAFRRWVTEQQGGAFRLIGTPERTWDWPHVEYVGAASGGAPLGYRSVDALVAAARACQAGAASAAEAAARCTAASPRPAAGVAATVVDDAPVARSHGGRRRGGHHGRSRGGKRSRGERSHAGRAHGGKSHSGKSHSGGSGHHAPKHRTRAR